MLLAIALTSSRPNAPPSAALGVRIQESESVGRSPRFNEVLILKLDSARDYSNPAVLAVPLSCSAVGLLTPGH